jgi:hypothetical protein
MKPAKSGLMSLKRLESSNTNAVVAAKKGVLKRLILTGFLTATIYSRA